MAPGVSDELLGRLTRDGTVNPLEAAIGALEAQRPLLGDTAVEAVVAALRQQFTGPLPAPGPPSVSEGEYRLVTLMFADLSGCAVVAERRGPQQARRLTNDCFEVLVPVIEKQEGSVEMFVGDAIMAVFGAPAASQNNSEPALLAALEMKAAVAAFNQRHGTDLGLQFGINTGQVVAGGIGTLDRQQYGVTGDPVNFASRLKAAAEPGEILVGPETQRLAGRLFEFEPVATIGGKGQSDPVAVYRLRGLAAGEQEGGE